ncbi:MAG: hypothetical protein AEth_00314 [Candidatus Argoarchaeum ethanivorans]|uniref:Uncharacterized protein n=1 Tax=Candidatus Argoarchaeum ethanivorans TaxID=2608793 RepID=A0A8B3S6G0_9EURY|nr:MAG: hypothetical protein AEth_00314 [Candidatus Argoarchaeum ethanivorans]
MASDFVGVSKNTGYIWQERWNEERYDGIIPKFAGGRPSKLTASQKEKLKKILEDGGNWTTKDVQLLNFQEIWCRIYRLSPNPIQVNTQINTII